MTSTERCASVRRRRPRSISSRSASSIARSRSLGSFETDRRPPHAPPATAPAHVGTGIQRATGAARRRTAPRRATRAGRARPARASPGSHPPRARHRAGCGERFVQPIDGVTGEHGEGLPVPASCLLDEHRLHASLPFKRATNLIASTRYGGWQRPAVQSRDRTRRPCAARRRVPHSAHGSAGRPRGPARAGDRGDGRARAAARGR